MIGEAFAFQWFDPDLSTPYDPPGTTGYTYPATVGAGIEFPGADDGVFDVDLTDSTIVLKTFRYFLPSGTFTPAPFNGIELTDTTGAVSIKSLAIDPATTNAANLTAANLSFDSSYIFLNLQDVSWDNGVTEMIFDVGTTTTPEPSAWVLSALCLAISFLCGRTA